MDLEPGVPRAAPAQVFLHDPMHYRRVPPLQLEAHGQHNVSAVVKDRIIISE
jgi:hypothetical protein